MTMTRVIRDCPRKRRSICSIATPSERPQRRRSMTRRDACLRAFLNWSEIVFFSEAPLGALNSQISPSISTSGFLTPGVWSTTRKRTVWPRSARAWAVRTSWSWRIVPSGTSTFPLPPGRSHLGSPALRGLVRVTVVDAFGAEALRRSCLVSLKEMTGPYSPCSVVRMMSLYSGRRPPRSEAPVRASTALWAASRVSSSMTWSTAMPAGRGPTLQSHPGWMGSRFSTW